MEERVIYGMNCSNTNDNSFSNLWTSMYDGNNLDSVTYSDMRRPYPYGISLADLTAKGDAIRIPLPFNYEKARLIHITSFGAKGECYSYEGEYNIQHFLDFENRTNPSIDKDINVYVMLFEFRNSNDAEKFYNKIIKDFIVAFRDIENGTEVVGVILKDDKAIKICHNEDGLPEY